jgi:tetratricopeptide (TPR) repeat protein
MPKEPVKPPVVEDLALRIKPPRGPARLAPTWLDSRVIVGLVAALTLAFLGALYLLLHDTGSFAKRAIEFPPLPKLNAAIVGAQERLKGDPQDISTLVELGTLHFEKGKEYYPDAINELEEARELGALDPRIFYCLGIMYQEVGLYTFALDEYKRFLRHYPDDKEIRMLAAKLLYKQGSFSVGVRESERLKYHYPGDSLIEENLGLSLWGAKETDRAIDSFNQLRGLGAEQAKRAEFYLGQLSFEKGDYKAAVEHLLKCQPDASGPAFGITADRLHTALALAYQKSGDLASAKMVWEQVVQDLPNDPKAKAALHDVTRRLPSPKKKR